MRKRNCRFEVCFTRDELSELTKKARKAHLSIGGFIRRAVSSAEIKEAPPAEYYELIRELRHIGSNLNQLLKIANTNGLFDAPRLRKALDANRELENMLWRVFQSEKN